MLWREVAVHQPWWKVLPAKPQYELRWSVVALLGGGAAVAAYKVSNRKRPPIIKIDPLMISSEGMIPGSALLENGRVPDCQVRLAIKRGDAYVVIGAGIRVENYLITPTHNGQHGLDLYMLKHDKAVKVDTEGEIILAADVSAFPLLETTWSQLGVKQAKLGPLARNANVTVTSSCDAKYSIGTARPSSDILGRVVYDASTMPGFSGSAYMNGNVCVGMHCHGGVRGGGYEMLYLWVRLKAQINEVPEESADFILQASKDQGYKLEELNAGKTVIRLDSGHYHLATDEIVSRMKALKNSASWYDQCLEEEYENELDRRGDYEPEMALIPSDTYQGEFRRPQERGSRGQQPRSPMDSSSKESSRVLPLTDRQRVMKELSNISIAQLDRFLRSRKNGKRRVKITPQQTPVPGPSGIASTTN